VARALLESRLNRAGDAPDIPGAAFRALDGAFIADRLVAIAAFLPGGELVAVAAELFGVELGFLFEVHALI
jgi:hypothetical protein